jgi:hypothetical protein
VHSALRDDAIAGVYRIGPAERAWQSLGQPFHDVVWTSVAEREHAWVVESWHRYDCYCSWSRVTWAAVDAGASNLLTDAVQLIPRGNAAPVAVEGEAGLNFHSSEACVVVVPRSSAGRYPFAYDLMRGEKTSLEGLRSIRWIDGE